MLFNIQILRAVAALLVVHAHAAGPAGLKLAWDGGANGVDLFFVISGFIIAYVASLDTRQFMVRRLIRIIPIYWSSTVALYLLVLSMPTMFRTTSSDPELFVRSLLFLPTSASVHTSDGLPHPTLAGGWTLNYEMYFYLIFAFALAVSHKWATTLAVAALLAVVVIVNASGWDSSPVAHFYGYPIVFEFAFGIIAFHLVRHAEVSGLPRRFHELQKLLLIAGVVVGLVCVACTAAIFGDTPRWIASGIPSFIIVVCAVMLERLHDLKITNRVAVMVGDASYVLYLIQAYVVYGITRLLIGDRRFSEIGGQLLTVVLMALSVVASVLVYRYYEQPLLSILKRRFIRSKPRSIAVANAAAAPRA